MSRTTRQPAHRRSHRTAEREFPYEPCAVPVNPWDAFGDPGLSDASRTAAAAWLRLRNTTPSDVELLAAACPHRDAGGNPVSCTETDPPGRDDVLDRAELTWFANGF